VWLVVRSLWPLVYLVVVEVVIVVVVVLLLVVVAVAQSTLVHSTYSHLVQPVLEHHVQLVPLVQL
jgi:hypothetical protein